MSAFDGSSERRVPSSSSSFSRAIKGAKAEMISSSREGAPFSQIELLGRLPCAVAPDQPDLLPGFDRERRAGEDLQVSTVVLYEISCDNHLHGTEIIQTGPLDAGRA